MLLRTKCAGMSIHIPLDIGNWRGIKNLADTFDDIVPHVRLCEVKQQLVAAQKILRPRLSCSAQSGCLRYRSESGLTDSGSNQSPNCGPMAFSFSPRPFSPFGSFLGFTE